MKRENLFMVNLDKDHAEIDREEFILRRESTAVKADRKMLDDKLAKAMLKGGLEVSIMMTVIFYSFLVVGLCGGVVALVNYFQTKVFPTGYLCIAVSFFILSGFFYAFKKRFDKKEDAIVDNIDEEYGRLNAISKRDMQVPSDAETVELFGRFYHKDSAPDDPYDVDEMTIFEEDGNICLQHTSIVIAVPIDSIEAVVKLKDTITFSDWMKDVPHDSEEYMQYHIVKRQVDEYDEEYSMNGYYSIRFSKEGTPFELLVPLYEIEPFLDILKLEVTEE